MGFKLGEFVGHESIALASNHLIPCYGAP